MGRGVGGGGNGRGSRDEEEEVVEIADKVMAEVEKEEMEKVREVEAEEDVLNVEVEDVEETKEEVLWIGPLDVPAQVRQLHVASDQQGSGQVETASGVGTDQLVVLAKSITEHLVQPGSQQQQQEERKILEREKRKLH